MRDTTDSTPRLIDLPVKNNMQGAADGQARDLEHLIRYYRDRGQVVRAYYDGLVDSGFESEDALILCAAEFSDQ